MKNLFMEAHKMAREIKRKYKDVDYKVQFSLCLSFLIEKDDEMGKLKEFIGTEAEFIGTETEIKLANDIRKDLLKTINEIESIKIEKIKKGVYVKKNMSIEETTKMYKEKMAMIKKRILSANNATLFIRIFKVVLEHNCLEQKSCYLNFNLKHFRLEKNIVWKNLMNETQDYKRLKRVKKLDMSYDEAKKKAKEIRFNDAFADETKEKILETIEIFEDALTHTQTDERLEKRIKRYIIEIITQENPQFYKNAFQRIKQSHIDNYKAQNAKDKIEIARHLFYHAVIC